MAAFDSLLRASFRPAQSTVAYAFPTSSIKVRGGLRDHVHEYPHSPGGAPELLGRKLYEFELTCPFVNTLRAYPKLWPETLATLRVFWEGQNSGDLLIPTIGTIPAYCYAWSEDADAHNRSGVTVTMSYREDQSGLFLVDKLVQVSAANLGSEATYFATQITSHSLAAVDIFRQIQNVANAVTALAEAVQVQGDLLQAKAEGLVRLCETADATVAALQQPRNVRVLESMHRIWTAAAKVAADSLGVGRPLVPFVVPAPMTISDVSRAIYGDNSHAMDLLKINAIPDPFAIPAGFSVRAFALAA